MSRGYALEHETESLFLELTGKSLNDPVSKRSHRITSSGAMRGDKGDVVSMGLPLSKQIMVECKRRKFHSKEDKKYYLKKSWILKNKEEATEEYFPIFIGAFTGVKEHRKFVVLTEELLTELGIERKSASYIDCNKFGTFILSHSDIKDAFSNNSFRILRISVDYYWVISYNEFTAAMEKLCGKIKIKSI